VLLAAIVLVPPILAACPGIGAAEGDPASPEGFDRLRKRAAQQAPAKTDEAPPPPRTKSEQVLDQLRQERKFQATALRQQMDMDLSLAKSELSAGKYESALQRARRTLATAQVLQTTPQTRRFREEATRIASEAQTKLERAKGERRQAELAAARKQSEALRREDLAATTKQGWRLYDRGEYEKALQVAEQVLLMAPDSGQGIYLKREASKALGRLDDVKALKTEVRKSHDNLLYKEIEEELVPPKDIEKTVVVAGDDDAEAPAGIPGRDVPAWERALRKKLRENVRTEFKDVGLVDACRHLSQITDTPIMIDPAVARNDKRVQLDEMELSFQHWLTWITQIGGATYALRDHAILITKPGGLLDRPTMREYDISGLLMPSRILCAAFRGATQGAGSTEEGNGLVAAAEMENTPETKDQIGNNWAQFIRSTIAADWTDVLQQAAGPNYSISYRNGRIVVVHTPEVHEEIARLLDNFRKARNLQVHIMARFIELDLDYLQSIDVDVLNPDDQKNLDPPGPALWGYDSTTTWPWSLVGDMDNQDNVGAIEGSVTADGGLNMHYSYLGENELHVLLQAVLKRRRGTLLLAPKLTCFNTQRANFQAVTNYNYVRTISSDNEPEIGNVPDGIIFDVQPFVSSDKRSITLVMQPQLRTLVDLPAFAYVRPLGSGLIDPDDPVPIVLVGTQRTVQVPVVQLKSIATTVTVPDGGTLLLGGLATTREQKGYASAPYIAQLPVLRHVLRDWTEAERRVSLVILVTAQIVPDVFED
jgi:general secretion pathway protein D